MLNGGVATGTRARRTFNEAEKLDPRNVNLLSQHARSYICLRRFPEALAKLEQILNITPDDIDTLVLKARIAQAEGDLPRAAALLAPLRLGADYANALETQVYQAILESRPATGHRSAKANIGQTRSGTGLLRWRTAVLVRLGTGS